MPIETFPNNGSADKAGKWKERELQIFNPSPSESNLGGGKKKVKILPKNTLLQWISNFVMGTILGKGFAQAQVHTEFIARVPKVKFFEYKQLVLLLLYQPFCYRWVGSVKYSRIIFRCLNSNNFIWGKSVVTWILLGGGGIKMTHTLCGCMHVPMYYLVSLVQTFPLQTVC